MSVSINTPSGRTMASAATVVSSTTASQNPAQAPAPPHWIAHQLSTGAAQSRYRQAKAVCFALRKPNPVPGWFEFHEVFHLGTVIGYACHVVAIYLIACAL